MGYLLGLRLMESKKVDTRLLIVLRFCDADAWLKEGGDLFYLSFRYEATFRIKIWQEFPRACT